MPTQTTNKESGLYIELYGNFVTEREYIKEWASVIIEDSAIASIEEFDNKYGSDYDLDDNETYSDFIHLFDEEVNNSRKDGLTIKLNNTDLRHSKVTLPRSNKEIDFEDLDLESTAKILDGLDIEHHLAELELDIEDVNIFDGENYISYIDNDALVIKTDVTDTNFTLEEFVQYQAERFDSEVSDKKILEALDLPKEQRVFLVTRNTQNNEKIDLEDCDYKTTINRLIDLDNQFICEDYPLGNDFVSYIAYKENGEFVFKAEEQDGSYSLNEFKEYLAERAGWNDQELNVNDINSVLGNSLKFTEKTMQELADTYPKYKLLTMHNDEDRKAFATQIEDLTNGKLSYGDFEIKDGFLINEDNQLIIVLPEKHLEERALFKKHYQTLVLALLKQTFKLKNQKVKLTILLEKITK